MEHLLDELDTYHNFTSIIMIGGAPPEVMIAQGPMIDFRNPAPPRGRRGTEASERND